VTGYHGRGAVDWVLSSAVVALADRGVHLGAAATERARAAADALLHELTEPDAVQEDDPSWEQQLAARVRAARERAGLSQAALAEAAGMSVPTVARCEAGAREMTAYDMACLALALDVCPGALIPPAEGPNSPEHGDPDIPIGT
jgi:ribosome-binding protein aMBF1 (putative translation factor)